MLAVRLPIHIIVQKSEQLGLDSGDFIIIVSGHIESIKQFLLVNQVQL